MAKYSYEFKTIILKKYLQGSLDYTLLIRKYDIPSTSPIEKWDNICKVLGKDDLSGMRQRKFILFNLSWVYQTLRNKQALLTKKPQLTLTYLSHLLLWPGVTSF